MNKILQSHPLTGGGIDSNLTCAQYQCQGGVDIG